MRYTDSGGHGEPLVLIHAAVFADWFLPLERELVLIEPPLIDPLLPAQDRAAVGAALGAAVGAAACGDLRTAFDTFLTAVCGPHYRTVLETALGRNGLARAERDCGNCFSGAVPALAAWQFGPEQAARIEQPVHLVAGGASPPFTHRVRDHLTELVPHSRSTVIPGRDHLLPLTAPGLVAELLGSPAILET